MANIVLSSKNRIDSTTSFYGDGDVANPLTNLRDPIFSKVWRYTPGTNNDGNVARIHFSLATMARMGHLALPRHNMNEAAQIRLRCGTARLDLDFTDDAELTSPYVTFGGGANGTRTNEYGVMVAGTCPRYEHDRRYFENGFTYSEDLTQSAWVADSGAVKHSDGQTVTFSVGDPAPGTGSNLYQGLGLGALIDDTYEFKVQARLVEGNGDFTFMVFNAGGYTQSSTKTAQPGEWVWYTGTLTTAAANLLTTHYAYIHKVTGAGVIQFRKFQIRRGASNGKYRKTTSQRLYQRIGVITEAGATNSLLRSQEFDNAAWTTVGATVTANTAIAPDGTTSMDRVTASVAGQYIYQRITAGGTTTRAASVFFRPDASTATDVFVGIYWQTGGVTQRVRCRFNASTGAFIVSDSTGATVNAAGVKDLGGGFYRAYVIGTGSDAANTIVETTLEVNVVAYVTAWGFQNEANYVTTYIPTTTAAVTRTVDTAEVETATWVPYALNAVEGTLYHEFMADDIPPDQSRAVVAVNIHASAGLFSNDLRSRLLWTPGLLYHHTTDLWTGGLYVWATAGVTVGSSAIARAAVRYRSGDFAASVGGVIAGTNASSVPAGVNRITLMRDPTCTSYLRRVTLWPTGKSNAELQSLTTSGPSAIDFDSGWDDVLQMTMRGDVPTLWGHDYDIVKTFSERAVEWVRVGLYDPAKTSASTPFEIGRAFMGKHALQPTRNAEYGLGNSWEERTTFTQAKDGREFFNELPRRRGSAFVLPILARSEGASMHEMQGTGGIVEETLYLPDPDDEQECQRYGGVGTLRQLDPIEHWMLATERGAVQWKKKR